MEKGWNRFIDLIEQDKIRRKHQRDQLKKAVQYIPISSETLGKISLLDPAGFSEVMKRHPGYTTQRKLGSLWAVLEIFQNACTDLQAAIQRFSTHNLKSRTPSAERNLEKILAAVQKEIFAASAAAAALKDHTHALRKHDKPDGKILVTDKEYEDSRRAAGLDLAQHKFVIELRNNLLHNMFIEASWQVDYSVSGRKIAFGLPVSQLLEGKWRSAEALAYIKGSGDKIDVATLFKDYRARVEDFYARLRQQIESHLPAEVGDYRRAGDAYFLTNYLRGWGLHLKLCIKRRDDPYAHLAQYLDPPQLEEVNRLPTRSLEQVNRIIELIDTRGACDDESRELVLRLFQVK